MYVTKRQGLNFAVWGDFPELWSLKRARRSSLRPILGLFGKRDAFKKIDVLHRSGPSSRPRGLRRAVLRRFALPRLWQLLCTFKEWLASRTDCPPSPRLRRTLAWRRPRSPKPRRRRVVEPGGI